tara:strand:+ start:44512 stop:45222 length:711 start_codon:yes stop_codon:yes gene_type:complete
MTKDYAKNKSNEFQNRARTKPGHNNRYNENASFFPPWAWLTTGIAIGFFLFALLDWKVLDHNATNKPVQTPQQASQTITIEEAPVAPVSTETNSVPIEDLSSEATRFDFYTLLPNMSVEMPEVPPANEAQAKKLKQVAQLAKKTKKIKTLPAPLTLPSHYILQVASFRSYNQAESLKATLALKGFESKIQSIKMRHDETWYRVYLGPFDDKNYAKSIQVKLESKQKMNSFVLKINV